MQSNELKIVRSKAFAQQHLPLSEFLGAGKPNVNVRPQVPISAILTSSIRADQSGDLMTTALRGPVIALHAQASEMSPTPSLSEHTQWGAWIRGEKKATHVGDAKDKDRILVSDSQEEQPRQNSRTPSPSTTPPAILDSQDEAAGSTMAGSVRKQKAVSRRPGGAQSSVSPALSPTKRKRGPRVSAGRGPAEMTAAAPTKRRGGNGNVSVAGRTQQVQSESDSDSDEQDDISAKAGPRQQVGEKGENKDFGARNAAVGRIFKRPRVIRAVAAVPSDGREKEQEDEDDEDDGEEGNKNDSPYEEEGEGRGEEEEEEEEGQGHVGTYESTPDWVQFNSNDRLAKAGSCHHDDRGAEGWVHNLMGGEISE